jgi:hypothetical protein
VLDPAQPSTVASSSSAAGAWRCCRALLLFAACVLPGCGATGEQPALSGIPRQRLLQTRPIGAGARFRPVATGTAIGRCSPTLGTRSAVHVEVFAANRVVIVAGGIGIRRPWTLSAGRVTHARCYGDLVTLEPTGVVLVRPGSHRRISALFRAWGQSLSPSRLASFLASPGTHVAAFIDGRRWRGTPGSVPLKTGAEIVLEVGPYVPPHATYTFAPGS